MALELRKVSLRVGAETHIYETDLTLQSGQFNILLGTTLSGKTSLMRLMAGREKPTSGELWMSRDEGRRWTCLARHFPEIYAVEAAEIP